MRRWRITDETGIDPACRPYVVDLVSGGPCRGRGRGAERGPVLGGRPGRGAERSRRGEGIPHVGAAHDSQPPGAHRFGHARCRAGGGGRREGPGRADAEPLRGRRLPGACRAQRSDRLRVRVDRPARGRAVRHDGAGRERSGRGGHSPYAGGNLADPVGRSGAVRDPSSRSVDASARGRAAGSRAGRPARSTRRRRERRHRARRRRRVRHS